MDLLKLCTMATDYVNEAHTKPRIADQLDCSTSCSEYGADAKAVRDEEHEYIVSLRSGKAVRVRLASYKADNT